jgi:hypothetical protein
MQRFRGSAGRPRAAAAAFHAPARINSDGVGGWRRGRRMRATDGPTPIDYESFRPGPRRRYASQ